MRRRRFSASMSRVATIITRFTSTGTRAGARSADEMLRRPVCGVLNGPRASVGIGRGGSDDRCMLLVPLAHIVSGVIMS